MGYRRTSCCRWNDWNEKRPSPSCDASSTKCRKGIGRSSPFDTRWITTPTRSHGCSTLLQRQSTCGSAGLASDWQNVSRLKEWCSRPERSHTVNKYENASTLEQVDGIQTCDTLNLLRWTLPGGDVTATLTGCCRTSSAPRCHTRGRSR